MGADRQDDGRWIRPEEVPDPVALRRLRPPSEPPAVQVAVQVVEAEAALFDPLSEPNDFTLEPPPLPVRRPVATEAVEPFEDTTEAAAVRPVSPRRSTPLAVWVAGTLLLVAALAVGGVWLGGSMESRARAPSDLVPAPTGTPEVQVRPTPVDQAPRVAVPEPATEVVAPPMPTPARHTPRRAPAKEPTRTGAPPTASVRAADELPPPAVVRPRTTPEPAPPPETGATADAVNPWVELD
jgi:hypothetical protein